MRALLLLPLVLAACAGPVTQPETRAPAAILQLDRMKDQAARSEWAALAAAEIAPCGGPNDAICAESQALRARGCRMQADAEPARRAPLLDCAVAGNRAALAASAATPPAERAGWNEALAWSLFARRQIQPRAALCADNAALQQAASGLDSSGASARFLGGSARLSAVAEGCAPAAQHCALLAEARALLTPAPANDPRWSALVAATSGESRRLQCR
jgi:hypothetical protein